MDDPNDYQGRRSPGRRAATTRSSTRRRRLRSYKAYLTFRGRKLLRDFGRLRPGSVFFCAHNLLTSGDGTPALKWGSTGAYGEDAQGRPAYNWSIVDRIFDTYLDCRVRPYVEIGFMPRELSVKPEPYQHRWTPTAKYDEIYTGWAYPPKDYAKWGELVYQWAKYCVEKYGRAEVESWYWETSTGFASSPHSRS